MGTAVSSASASSPSPSDSDEPSQYQFSRMGAFGMIFFNFLPSLVIGLATLISMSNDTGICENNLYVGVIMAMITQIILSIVIYKTLTAFTKLWRGVSILFMIGGIVIAALVMSWADSDRICNPSIFSFSTTDIPENGKILVAGAFTSGIMLLLLSVYPLSWLLFFFLPGFFIFGIFFGIISCVMCDCKAMGYLYSFQWLFPNMWKKKEDSSVEPTATIT